MEELDRDLLAAIGEVVVEATALEYALARLVAARCGWTEDQAWALTANPGRVRKNLKAVTAADKDWHSLRRLQRNAWAVLEDRNALVHSLVVEVTGDDLPAPRMEIWHPRSGTTAEQPTVADVLEHAFDIRRCFKQAAQLLDEAGARYRSAGTVQGIGAPEPVEWRADQEGLE